MRCVLRHWFRMFSASKNAVTIDTRVSNKTGRVQPVSHRRARRVTLTTHDRRRDGRAVQTCVTQASAARPNDTVSRIAFICTQVPGAGGVLIRLYMCPLALRYASLLLDSMYMIRYITPTGVKGQRHARTRFRQIRIRLGPVECLSTSAWPRPLKQVGSDPPTPDGGSELPRRAAVARHARSFVGALDVCRGRREPEDR